MHVLKNVNVVNGLLSQIKDAVEVITRVTPLSLSQQCGVQWAIYPQETGNHSY